MSIGPILPGRLPNSLVTAQLQRNLQQATRLLARLQDQAATGQKYFVPSESPASAIRAISLQTSLERQAQLQVNVTTDRSLLAASENALAAMSDFLIRGKTLLIAGTGDTASAVEKLAMATEIAAMVRGATNTANSKFLGRYLFAGSETGQEPFSIIGGGYVQYNGDTLNINSYIDVNALQANNVDGQTAFQALTAPVGGSVNPALTLDTRIADLHAGQGVKLGVIVVTVDNGGPVTQTVDLTGAETIRDIKTRLENAFGAGVLTVDIPAAPSANGIRLTPVAGTVAVSDLSGATVARDLGIAATASAVITGQDLDPRLTLQTPLSAFNGGNGVTTANGLLITNGLLSKTVDISSATNVEELFNLLRAENLQLDLRINDAGDGLAISSRISGAEFSIGENGGTDATSLGIRTLTGSTLLSALNYGNGVPLNLTDSNGVLLPATINIIRRDGVTTSTIDLKGLTTVQDVLDAITAVDANLTATLNSVGNGISIVDTSGTGPLEVDPGDVAYALKLNGVESGSVNTVPLIGQDMHQRRSNGVISLLVQLESALRLGDNFALADLDSQFNSEINRINLVRGEVGSRMQTLDEVENRLLDQELLMRQTLSDEFDADLATIVTQVADITATLEATLKIATVTLGLSLLSFL